MTDPHQQPITGTFGLDTRAGLDTQLEQETRGAGISVHGIKQDILEIRAS